MTRFQLAVSNHNTLARNKPNAAIRDARFDLVRRDMAANIRKATYRAIAAALAFGSIAGAVLAIVHNI